MVKRAVVTAGTAVALGVGLVATSTASAASGMASHHQRTYEVTIANTTVGQPFSPPFVAVHNRHTDLWSVGDVASHPVAAIAEDADNAPAIALAGKLRGVKYAMTAVAIGAASPAPIGPGARQTFRVTTADGYRRLTLLTMLVNSNDAFTGLDAVRLPSRVGRSVHYTKMAYDAGSEANNEMAKYIPGPVGGHRFVRDPEGELIRMHPGVVGGADLDPVTHKLSGTVATITIKRVR